MIRTSYNDDCMLLKWIADHFGGFQIGILVLVFIFAWNTLRSRQKESSFRSREFQRSDLGRLKTLENDLANSKIRKPQSPAKPLHLPGITLVGKPHEILGVVENANESEIMRAYKEKIKQFHPDRIQGQAREQIKFYEEASAKLNEAKELMLTELKRK